MAILFADMAEQAKLDRLDISILAALQRDASQSLAALSETVGLSSNACWKRIRRLEEAGYVERRVALLSPEKLGLNLTALVAIRTDQHNQEWLDQFAEGVRNIPEVVEFYRMSGQVDYMLKIVCRDIADYDRVYKRLIRTARLSDVSGSFAMERIKWTTELPLP